MNVILVVRIFKFNWLAILYDNLSCFTVIFCSTFETNIQLMFSVRLKLWQFFSFCIKKLCIVKKQKSWGKKRDLFFFEKSQYCLTSVFDIPINLVLAVSLLTIYPLGSKHQYNSFHTFGASSPTESLKFLRVSVIASINFVTFIIVCKNHRTPDQ